MNGMQGGTGVGELERLFKDRTAESAAWQLALVLAHATECELATVERLEMRKRPPKSELQRHRDIAETLVYHCKDLGVSPRGLLGRPCPRLAEKLCVSGRARDPLHVGDDLDVLAEAVEHDIELCPLCDEWGIASCPKHNPPTHAEPGEGLVTTKEKP